MKKIDRQKFFYVNRGFKPKSIKINLADQFSLRLGELLKRVYEEPERKLFGEVYEEIK